MSVNYKLALTKNIADDWTTKAFATCLYRDWTPRCYSCWPSTTPEGVQGGVRHSVYQGIWWDRRLDSWMLLEQILRSQSLHLLISRDTLNSFMVRPSWLTKKPFVNWVLHGIELPLHQNLIYWLSPTAALEQSLRVIWDAASQAAVLIWPQIKLSHNSQVVHLFLVDMSMVHFSQLIKQY